MPKELRSLADAIKENRKLGDVGSFEEYLNQQVVIHGAEFKSTKYGAAAYVTISLTAESEQFIVLTHSTVVLGQLQRIEQENAFPLLCTLTKEAKYYILR